MHSYFKKDCIYFAKTGRDYGELSNMHNKFPLHIATLDVPSSEHLYQLLRFTEHSEVQQQILSEPRPMGSKFIAKEHIDKTRGDWEVIKPLIMQWVVYEKISQYYNFFSNLLLNTSKPIVELSMKDNYWGAIPQGDGSLLGHNALGVNWSNGRDLMKTKGHNYFQDIHLPDYLENMTILGKPLN